jgi:pimeloyl-ACP methyl ester carboxylesterase
MSTDTRPNTGPSSGHTSERDELAAVPSGVAPQPGPVARVVAASLAIGAATAAVLTFIVFAGAAEAVIIGSVLISFGLGWGLVATLTARHTNRPQRWAAVPAVLMGLTGALLLALRPGNDAMATVNWVWPPVVLALAVWMLVQMRRAGTGRGTWLLTPVVAVLVLAAVSATYTNVTLRADQDIVANPPGTLYDVDGHRMHLDCHGQGSPTVVLFNGLGEVSASWARVSDPVAATTRICAYDRAGQGWSDDVSTPQDAIAAAADLHSLLEVAGVPGPYVLAGHSSGGTYAMTYAARYPDQVAGMVLLDSSSPDQPELLPTFDREFAVTRRVLALGPTVARLGFAGLVASSSHLPAEAAAQVEALTASPRGARTLRDEQSVLLDVFTQAKALTTLDGRPLFVLTASENLASPGWATAQDQLADLSTDHVHRTVTSTHLGLLEDTGPAAQSVRAITDTVAAARTRTPLSTQ